MERFKMFACCLTAALILGFGAGNATADDGQNQAHAFVDENGDGLPDGPMGQNRHGVRGSNLQNMFIDEDGDGVNDLTQDADNDGVPNGRDSDYLTQKGIVLGRGWMGHGFVDEDGNGVNDLTQDADNDGVPNGMDTDYTLPEGVAFQRHAARGMMGRLGGFIDEDGDGLNDLMQDSDNDGILNGFDADYALPEGVGPGSFGGYGMGHGNGFVDADGNGINDLMQDADSDGIPNGIDADYALPTGLNRATGGMHGRGNMGGMMQGSEASANVNPPSDGADMAKRTNSDAVVNKNAPTTGSGVQNQNQMGHGRGMMGQNGRQGNAPAQEEEETKRNGN